MAHALTAISSMATRPVLRDLASAAAAAGLPAVEVTSVGGVDAAARVRAGEAFDLTFLADGALHALADEGLVDTVTPLLLSQVAVAVPDPSNGSDSDSDSEPGSDSGSISGPETPGPAFADAAEFRAALQAAPRIGYSTGPSGTALARMVDEWGLTAEVGPRLVQARPGVPVAAMLALGQVDLGLQQLSELAGGPGIRILGVLPEDCAILTVFSGAVGRRAADPSAASRLLSFLRSGDAAAIARAHRFQPIGVRD